MRARWLASFLVLLAAGPLNSQTSLSYITLDHRVMPFLEYLVAKGAVRDPSPMERPWVVGPMLAALDEADRARLSASERRTLDEVRRMLDTRDDPVVIDAHARVGVRAATHDRRWPLREAGEGHVYPLGDLHLALQFGPAVLVTHPELDPRAVKWDPDYIGKHDDPLASRFQSAYVAVHTKYFHGFFGSVARNWGPPERPGVLVSPWPYSYDHLMLQAGPEKVYLQTYVAQLDEIPDEDGDRMRRYWIVARVVGHPWETFNFALWQGTLISGDKRSLEFWFVNPLKFAKQTVQEEGVRANNLLGLDLEVRPRGWPRLGLSLLVDDFQLIGSSTNDEPPSYAFTLAATGPIFGGLGSLTYTQVSNLVYRTPDPTETVMRRSVGLGRNFSDYDETSVNARWIIKPGILVGPEFTLLRQGEGDFRNPFPPDSLNSVTPTIFDGVVENTWRAAVWGQLLLPFSLAAQFDAGVHHITDYQHQESETTTRFVGSVALRFRFGWDWALR